MRWVRVGLYLLSLPALGLAGFLEYQARNGVRLNTLGGSAMLGGVIVGLGSIALASYLGRTRG